MWEARCLPETVDEVLPWVRSVAASALAAGATGAEVLRAEERLVLLTRWGAATAWVEPPELPATVVRAHAWAFEPA